MQEGLTLYECLSHPYINAVNPAVLLKLACENINKLGFATKIANSFFRILVTSVPKYENRLAFHGDFYSQVSLGLGLRVTRWDVTAKKAAAHMRS